MRTRGKSGVRAGYTIIEIMVVLAISSVLLYTITAAVKLSVGAYRSGSTTMNLEARGSRAMHRIVEALRGTDASMIAVVSASPFSDSTIMFQDFEEFDGTSTAASAPRTISLSGDEVVFTESPGTANERSATWADGVPALFSGETANLVDDNGNGLIDEAGLAFVRNGDSIDVHLTLTSDDGSVTRTWTTTIHCRN